MLTTLQQTVAAVEAGARAIARMLHILGIWIFLPLLMLLVTIDVVFRYFFSASLQGATEVSQLLLLTVFFASLPYCTFQHGHVYMELIYLRLSGWRRQLADCLTAVCGLVFAGLFTWQAVFTLQDMMRYGDGAEMVDLPYWPFAAILLVCGLFTALGFALQLSRVLLAMPVDRREFENE